MPKKSEFVLKDCSPEFIKAAGVEPKGRSYCTEIAKQPGAVRIKDVLLGTKLACVSITDDEPGTLAKVGKMNPWHIEALKMITGSDAEAHKPLTEILDNYFDLETDKIIDITGWNGGRAVDLQGFIAHNDDIIVVSFRCTTSVMDWMTNFSVTSSEWEPNEDLAQGHSGRCSCLEGRCFVKGGKKKPRVHTGFYNNCLRSIPLLEEYVKPFLAADQPPRKLYVVGHSLGAGISTLATCYFLLNYDWKNLPHKLINVSAGTPRSCKQCMADLINRKLGELRPLDKAIVVRVVMNEDMVTKVPPPETGYTHVGKCLLLTEDGEVLVGPKMSDTHIINESELREMQKRHPSLFIQAEAEDEEGGEDTRTRDKVRVSIRQVKTKYEKMLAKTPRPLRDHMPDQYLQPIVRLYEHEQRVQGEAMPVQ